MTLLATSRLRLEPITDQHPHGLHSVEAVQTPRLLSVCNPADTALARVMQRLGMRYRGVERWYETDCSSYEMTHAEWLAREV